MFGKKYINFHICETNEPCSLYFYSEKGKLLEKIDKTKKPLNFCLTTCSSMINVLAKFNGRYEYLCFFLDNRMYQNIYITFGTSVIYLQRFILLDLNYHFQIKKAILNFSRIKKAL